jgi:hypothetical protein
LIVLPGGHSSRAPQFLFEDVVWDSLQTAPRPTKYLFVGLLQTETCSLLGVFWASSEDEQNTSGTKYCFMMSGCDEPHALRVSRNAAAAVPPTRIVVLWP